jgi:SAM-dependent methyltransferase
MSDQNTTETALTRDRRILDLGCGNAKVEGAVGVEITALSGVDVIADLSHFPYPFADNTFDEIHMLDVIEHIPNTIRVMEEIWRMAVPDAHVFIRVVNWNHRYTAMDPTHVRAFTENSFDFFGKRAGRSYYTQARFDVERVEHFFNPRVARRLRSRRLMRFLSDYLCNILQGLKFDLRVRK